VWEWGGSGQGLRQGVHDRVVTAAVADNRQPKPAGSLKQRLAQLCVLLLEFSSGVLQPGGVEVPMQLDQ
jgi:hypothetical protein